MPRFFFNISSPTTFLPDDIGVEFETLDQVRIEAIKGARGIMAEDLQAGRPVDHQQFQVHDATGILVLVLRFRDVLTVPDNYIGETKF